jgi:exopolyphosphatase / guanosine-5'-triphosphate,3'-diphosphate pyrophosphatase
VTRVAAVDLGTSSTRLLVADVADGRVAEVSRRATITRLGEGVDVRHRLLPVPIARVRNCLADYRREAESLGAERILAVATSAVRDAENGDAFLGEIEWSYGFATRLLSGEEEAGVTYRGVTAGRALPPGTLVVDVGGGSTELAVDGRDPVSLDVGVVRLTERHGDDLEAAAEHVRSLLPELSPSRAIGVAGTVTTLAALELGGYDPERVHGHRISARAVEAWLERLAGMSLEERRSLPGLEPARAPVIVAGVLIVREVLRAYRLDELEASEHDLLHGVALEAAELPAAEEGDAPPGACAC